MPVMELKIYDSFSASRIRPMFDFGFVALDLLYAYPEDSGVYTCLGIARKLIGKLLICLVSNELGSAESSVELSVAGGGTLYLEPQHPEGLERIIELDQPKIYGIAEVPDRESDNPPRFLTNLQNIEIQEHEDLLFDLKAS